VPAVGKVGLRLSYNSKKSIVIQQYYSFALFYPDDHLLLVVDQDHATAIGGA
jgi:hypothetical protein